MFELRNVCVSYGGVTVLDHLNVIFGPTPTALMGPSGSGKTTLLRLMAGQQAPTRGEISLAGQPVKLATWNDPGDPRVGCVYQDYRLVDFLTVGQNVALGAESRGRRMSRRQVVDGLERVGLGHIDPDRFPRTLSGGEQQRVAIARTIASGCEVIVADEPTGALDVDTTGLVAQLLLDLATTAGLGIIVATHDHAVARRMDQVLHIENGTIRSDGARHA